MRPLTLLMTLGVTAASTAAELTVGAARVDITPPKGMPMAGYYAPRAAEGTHDKLYASAVVIEKDGTRAALVSLDLIGTTFVMTGEARKLIEGETKIRGGHVMLFATHSHTGPVLSDKAARAGAMGGEQKIAVEYMSELPKKVAEAVQAELKRAG